LVLGARFQHAAPQDVGEQFVAGLLERSRGGRASRFRTFLGHAQGAPVCSNWRWVRGNQRRNVIRRWRGRKGSDASSRAVVSWYNEREQGAGSRVGGGGLRA